MNLLLFFIIFFVAAFLLLILFTQKKAKKEGTTTAKEIMGICNVALDRTVRKQANLKKAVELFNEKPRLTNAEIRECLGVSERTVIGYMSDLEKQEIVEQVGETGRGVYYRLKR